ncbi:PREDICTED: N-terminal Xaa-Pro-Lys N-methyltransferase 1 [Nicrophorus vespilloides]|uniref:Alpha N-terminal protein methyltransferase 1 n=1 Tax=Nicrophorus vespilloides TaxID=110193 RepID=A0ABM1NBY3_NICVS|nr:PREDICTED: N-terminal Xaa-Pro-Lys N-methyltransferase 1 [Nicrophorus vespilloides]
MCEKNEEFYTKAKEYWAEIPATVDGMLGGYGHVSQTDIQGSRHFLKTVFQGSDSPGTETALDCGAGIGRITKHLLSTIFMKVDLVEQNAEFLEQAKDYLQPEILKIGEFYPISLQYFQPQENKYDVVWMQWVLGHLTDDHLVDFLITCKKSLKPKGVIVIKENLTANGEVEVDECDSSVTRPYKAYMEIFQRAGVKCYRKQKQAHFPKELFTVYMFALRPNANCDNDTQ